MIVLLDDVPDCLLHITLEGLNLETFRDREGLQLELQFRLVQTKLFMRNSSPSKRTSLMELQMSGCVSVDVVANTGRIKKLGLQLKNTKISVSDGKSMIIAGVSGKIFVTFLDLVSHTKRNPTAPMRIFRHTPLVICFETPSFSNI